MGKTSNSGGEKDRLAGSTRQAVGKMKKAAGDLLGDAKLKNEGRADIVEGKVRNAIGGIKEALRGGDARN